MTVLSKITQHIARSPGDPKVVRSGPSSLTPADRLARSLAWLSFGIGVTELVAPHRITRTIGLEGKEGLVRAYGAREVASSIPTMSMDKQVGLMMRIVGDGLDLATVAPALRPSNPQRGNAAVTLASLVGITALDILALKAIAAVHMRSPASARDYGDRSGLPLGLERSRGLARRDFQIPPDLRAAGTVAEALSDGMTQQRA